MKHVSLFEDFDNMSKAEADDKVIDVKDTPDGKITRKILDVTSRPLGEWGELGIVALHTQEVKKNYTSDFWCVYIGLVDGKDNKKNAVEIIEKGGKVMDEGEAYTYFPKFKEKTYDWSKFYKTKD